MTTDPDPFEEGQRAAQANIPAEGNPYREPMARIAPLRYRTTSFPSSPRQD
jgi:hypothetical protein